MRSPSLYLRISRDPQFGEHRADSFMGIVTRQACYNLGSSEPIRSHVADEETKAQRDSVGCSTAEWLSWDSEFNSKVRSPSKLSCCLRFQKPHQADGETNARRGEVTCSRLYGDW